MKKIFSRRWARTFCFLIATCFAPLATHATEYDVYIDETGFDPNYLEVNVGDAVVWVNFDFSGSEHSSHSTTYPWNSGPIASFEGAQLTTAKPGAFPYQDDFTGLTATLVILSALPVLTNGIRLPNGTFQLTVTNLTVGKTNVLQGSTNLVNWTNLYTNAGPSTGFTYVDNAAATLKHRFYRAWVQP